MKHVNCYSIIWGVVLVAVIAFINVSCQHDETCKENMRTGMVCEFTEAYWDESPQIRFRTSWDSITVIGIGLSETLYANSKNIQKLVLPLKKEKDADTTIYFLTYHNMVDTLSIYHTSQLEFVNVECGCTFNHDILKLNYTQHWIDTISILQTTIDRNAETNIRFERSTLEQ